MRRSDPLEELHGEKELAIGLSEVEDLDDISVIERNRDPGLVDEVANEALLIGKARPNALESENLFKTRDAYGLCLVHLGHPTLSYLLEDVVLAQAHRILGHTKSIGYIVRGMPAPRDIGELEIVLGHDFSEREHLVEALTHRSYANEENLETDNERLEFLGDAVVDLVVGHLLMRRCAELGEGALSQARAQLVSEAGLSRLAREIRLGEWLRLGKGEDRSGGRTKASLLANAFRSRVRGALPRWRPRSRRGLHHWTGREASRHGPGVR